MSRKFRDRPRTRKLETGHDRENYVGPGTNIGGEDKGLVLKGLVSNVVDSSPPRNSLIYLFGFGRNWKGNARNIFYLDLPPNEISTGRTQGFVIRIYCEQTENCARRNLFFVFFCARGELFATTTSDLPDGLKDFYFLGLVERSFFFSSG